MTLNTHNYPGISTSEASVVGKRILEERIAKGRASAGKLVEHVHQAVPTDTVIRGTSLQFEPVTKTEVLDSFGNVLNSQGISVGWLDEPARPLHRHALAQVASKAGVPGSFITDLATAPEPWKRELAADTLNRHFQNEYVDRKEDISRRNYLVRSVRGERRGFLSDRYRRIDSRPTLEAFAEECQKVGAHPYEGIVSDVRVSLRAIIPVVFEPVQGEILAFGAEWGNSDFGAAKHWFRTFILRLWCLNGATMEDVLSQVHTGSRLSDNFEFSQRTYELDTNAQVSALRDVVRGALGPKQVDASLALIKQAHEKQVEWKGVAGSLAKRLTKGEQKLVKDAFEGHDVINLPPVKSQWRLSNALSWIANGEEVETDRKLELQRLAGEVLNGKRDAAVDEAA